MSIKPTVLVRGTDGVVPVYEPNSVWKIWALEEIYTGHEGNEKYVPKVNDYVIDYENDKRYKVISVDNQLIAHLEEIVTKEDKHDQAEDILTNFLGYKQAKTYRVYIDTSVNPHTLSVDCRFLVAGTLTHHAQIFRGSKVDGTYDVISSIYDQSGRFISNKIPLELVYTETGDNHAIKYIPTCHTTADLVDGEIVEVITYNDVGDILDIYKMLVENTSAIIQRNSKIKYITDIRLDSPWLSTSDPSTIQYPLNIPVSGWNLFGIVDYSDGSSVKFPVDQTKFSTLGLRDYISTTPETRGSFTLKYTLSKYETAIGSKSTSYKLSDPANRFITKKYHLQSIEQDAGYTVKLFAYPVFIDNNSGYRLDYYLLNLERNICKYVTPYVHYNTNTLDAFDGKRYNITQTLSVAINLKEVGVAQKDFNHVQIIQVTLLNQTNPQSTDTKWYIGDGANDKDPYGKGIYALADIQASDRTILNFSSEISSQDEWLTKFWRNTSPVYDILHEAGPPTPDVFRVITRNKTTEFAMSMWNRDLTIQDEVELTDTIFIQFIKRSPSNDLILGISGVSVAQKQ